MYQSPARDQWVTLFQPVRENNMNAGLLAPMLTCWTQVTLVLSLDFKCTNCVALVMFSDNVFCLIIFFFSSFPHDLTP